MATTKKTTPKKTTTTAAKKPAAKAATKPAVKKAAPKTVAKATPKAAAKTVKKPVAKKAAPKAAPTAAAKTTGGLHYDKNLLLTEYNTTFDVMMKLTVLSIGGVLLYFFIMVTFLGGFSHTKTNDFAEKFSDRIDLGSSYDGLKLPMYQNEE